MDMHSHDNKVFFLADRAFLAHSTITLVGVIWSLLIQQYYLLAIFIALWLSASVVWFEWRNGG